MACSDSIQMRSAGIEQNGQGSTTGSITPGARRLRAWRLVHPLEWGIANAVVPPVFVIEVPPFGFEDAEALVFHGAAEEVATGSLFGGASGVGGVGAERHLVVDAGHFDFAAGLEIVESEIDGAAPIVAGGLRGGGAESRACSGGGVAGHFDFAAGLEIVESEIGGAAAIVAGPFGGVGNEFVLVRWSRVPEDL